MKKAQNVPALWALLPCLYLPRPYRTYPLNAIELAPTPLQHGSVVVASRHKWSVQQSPEGLEDRVECKSNP